MDSIEKDRSQRTKILDRPVFILGCAKSGSTLLAGLLLMHPEVGPKPFDYAGPAGLRKLIEGIPNAGPDRESILNPEVEQKETWDRFFPLSHVPLTVGRELTLVDSPLSDRQIKELVASLTKRFRERRFLSKLPSNAFRVHLLRGLFPDAKFVAIYRNGPDVVGSWGDNWSRWESMGGYGAAISLFARKWTETVEYLEKHKHSLGILTLRYEELTRDPEPVIRSVLDFCELSWPEDLYKNLLLNERSGLWRDRVPESFHAQVVADTDRGCQLLGYQFDYRSEYKGYWERSDRWGSHSFHDPQAVADEILSIGSDSRSFLDVGCGMGQLVRTLLGRNRSSFGLDVADRPIREADRVSPGRFLGASAVSLPFGDSSFDTVCSSDCLEHLTERDVRAALGELSRVAKYSAFIRLSTSVDRDGRWHLTVRNREWWEERFLGSGLRYHPLLQRVCPVESLDHETWPITLAFEKVPVRPEPADPTDLLRNPGRKARVFHSLYAFASALVRPGDFVVDISAGAGAGCHVLSSVSEADRIVGVVDDPDRLAYAGRHYGGAGSSVAFLSPDKFRATVPPASIDVVILIPPAESPEILNDTDLQLSIGRMLKPGGRLLVRCDADRVDLASSQRIDSPLEGDLLVDEIHGVFLRSREGYSAGVANVRSENPVRPDFWVVSLIRDPLSVREDESYSETLFPWHGAGSLPNPVAFSRDYENPWLAGSMVLGSYRVRSRTLLASLAGAVAVRAKEASADQGAALCVLGYRLLESAGSDFPPTSDLLRQIEKYLGAIPPNPHAFRWQISLSYLRALLLRSSGALREAEEAFRACGKMDFLRFAPHLGTKSVDACFQAGMLALTRGDEDRAREDWFSGVRVVERLMSCSLESLLVNVQEPAPFERGDGLREITLILDSATLCANGLRFLARKSRGERALVGEIDRNLQRGYEEMLRVVTSRGGEIRELRFSLQALQSETHFLRDRVQQLERSGGATEAMVRAERARARRLVRRLGGRIMKRIVIFGAGDGGRRVWEKVCMRGSAEVAYIVDSDPRKQGLPFLGSVVRPPEVLVEKDYDLVLVSSVLSEEILARLRALEVPENKVFVPQLSLGDAALERSIASVVPQPEFPVPGDRSDAKRIGIFGTGQGGLKVWEALMSIDSAEPVWFADNDPERQGRILLWLDVISPGQIPVRPCEFVIVASMYRESICSQLIQLGIPEKMILTPTLSSGVPTVLAELQPHFQMEGED